jgi:molybdopterin-binding protein
VNGQIKIDIGGGNVITSSITEEAIADFGLVEAAHEEEPLVARAARRHLG